MAKPLWAPWRLEYIKQAHEQTGCVFCDEAAGALDPDESLRVFLGDTALAILNKYPYSSGHLMVAPRRHLGELKPESPDLKSKSQLAHSSVGFLASNVGFFQHER